MKYSFLIIIIIFSISNCYSQWKIVVNDQALIGLPAVGLVGGVSGFKSSELEAGFGLNLMETRPENHVLIKPFMGCSLSVLYDPNNPEIIGESFNIWLNTLFVLGLNQNYHKFENYETWGLKPFFGLEFYGISFSYGYNFFLNKNEIEELNHNIFSMRYFLPIVKFKKKKS